MNPHQYNNRTIERITYMKRTSIKLWNLYDDNIIAYFKKKFNSYLSEMGLSWHSFTHPKDYIEVRNQQTPKTSNFWIFIYHEKRIDHHFLNMDLNHLLFFDISDKGKEYRVLNQFSEILKIKNESNEKLKKNKITPSFFLIFYDSTNEKGEFHPPEKCSISLPIGTNLDIKRKKHFECQGFYEWLYKTTDRISRVIRSDINPEVIKYFQDLHENPPFPEINNVITLLLKYQFDNYFYRAKKSQLSQILEHFSHQDLRQIRRKLKLPAIPLVKKHLINVFAAYSAETNIRYFFIEVCQKMLQNKLYLEEIISKKLWLNDIYLQFNPNGNVLIRDKNIVLKEFWGMKDEALNYLLNLIGLGKYQGKKDIRLKGEELRVGFFSSFNNWRYRPNDLVYVCGKCDSFLGIDCCSDKKKHTYPEKYKILRDHTWGSICPFCKNELIKKKRPPKEIEVIFDPTRKIIDEQKDWDATVQDPSYYIPVLYKGEQFYYNLFDRIPQILLTDDINVEDDGPDDEWNESMYSSPYGPFKIQLSHGKYGKMISKIEY
jgi:hypothetical protein